jgi:hypothetical protein
MIRMATRSFLFASLSLMFVGARPAWSQWASDSVTNTVVCDTTGQQDYPQICSDGSNGAIIVWEDARSNYFTIYAQHLDANGYATWARNGVQLAQSNADQQYPIIASDGSGGAYVVWQDERNSSTKGTDLYGQHILANGALGYSSAGIAVSSATGTQNNEVICSDGSGNAFVAWEDSRNSIASSRPDIYLNRMTSGGVSFGSSGMVVDASVNRQVGPAICPDGTGGCYVAWQDEGLVPSTIFARRISSSGAMLWGLPPPNLGIKIYQSAPSPNNPQPNSSDISISLDDNQLLLTWEVTNSASPADGQDILAQRMLCSTPSDTTAVYPDGPIEVTGAWLNDQLTPQIFSDDSLWNNGSTSVNGILVPFLDLEPGSTDDYDVAMVRVLSDGTTALPPSGNGFFYLEQQPHAQTGFKAVKITDSDPTKNGILAVWNDARYAGLGLGKDTTIFAQRIDRNGHNYFPTNGSTKLAQPLCSGPGSNGWMAREVALAPRTDGGIAVWTDFRKGATNPGIYAQLILIDGSLWIPSDTTQPILNVLSTTTPDNNSECNSQCTTVIAIDPGTQTNSGLLKSGIDSLTPVAMTNMKLDTVSFTKGADSVTFSVCVIDSFQNGSGNVKVVGTDLKAQSMSFTYCTILDTSAPLITVDTLTTNPLWLAIHIRDDRPWDRGLNSVIVSDTSNISFSGNGNKIISGENAYDDTVSIINSSLVAQFCIKAVDVSGNVSPVYCFTTNTSAVSPSTENPISLSVFPNPTSGDVTMLLGGAPFADVTVSDVLGRTVGQFHLEGSHEWQASSLAPGTYIVRAIIGGLVISKRIVRE